MPHLTIEHSANVADHVDLEALLDAVHERAAASPLLPLAGLRTRLVPRERYRIADGDPANMFVAVTARIGAGRSDEEKERLLHELVDAVMSVLGPVQERHPLAVSLEITEIDPRFRVNRNNLHERLEPSP